MTLSPRTRRNLLRILPFGIIWLLAGWLFLAIEFYAVRTTDEWAETAIRMDFRIFVFASFSVIVVGLVLGAFEVLFVEKLFARLSFGKKLLYKLIFYIILFTLFILVMYPIAASFELSTGVFDAKVWERYFDFFVSKTNLSTMMQMSASQFCALFYTEIAESIGHRSLINFFTGKYHRPVEEERIFMFVDMRSSTSIAEQLGHHRYFNLLNAFYTDLSQAIIDHAGEVYQYVGDEVIVTWTMQQGVTDARCIRCFYAMQRDLEKRRAWYEKEFGIFPAFKAGLHGGMVTTGEIGVVKKDIFFTSDVLNVTSRIQGLCNTYGTDLLLSEDLIDRLTLPPDFIKHVIGETGLRGRAENMKLVTITSGS